MYLTFINSNFTIITIKMEVLDLNLFVKSMCMFKMT